MINAGVGLVQDIRSSTPQQNCVYLHMSILEQMFLNKYMFYWLFPANALSGDLPSCKCLEGAIPMALCL